jgi:ElaB/YqjD/DUF883 family membrane-anchored ribosome-binding protein
MSDTTESNTAVKKLESSTEHAKKALDAAANAGRVVGETVKAQAKEAFEASRGHLGAAAKDLGEAASTTYQDLRYKANHFLDDASGYAQSYQTEAEAYIRENPLQSVGIALGVGFLLGIIIRR